MATTALVLKSVPRPVRGSDGEIYEARICGRAATGEQWEAWIEFTSLGSGRVRRSSRETLQPNYRILRWWADGVTGVYLEGALERTLDRERPRHRKRATPPAERSGRTTYAGPAPVGKGARRLLTPDDSPVNPALLHHQGEEVIRARLEELPKAELNLVIRAYRMDRHAGVDVDSLSRGALIELIVSRVRSRSGRKEQERRA